MAREDLRLWLVIVMWASLWIIENTGMERFVFWCTIYDETDFMNIDSIFKWKPFPRGVEKRFAKWVRRVALLQWITLYG
jgi:hypothetical protein